MKLGFEFCTRGIAIAVAAIFLSGCTSFSTLFENSSMSFEDQSTKQQRLGAIQMRVAMTAIAHRGYEAAISLLSEASSFQSVRPKALFQLVKLHRQMRNSQAERRAYRTLLKEYPDHPDARRLKQSDRQKIAEIPIKTKQIATTQPKAPNIGYELDLSTTAEPSGASNTKPIANKRKIEKIYIKQHIKNHLSESRYKTVDTEKAPLKSEKAQTANQPVTTTKVGEKIFRVQLAAYRYKSNAVRALSQFNSMFSTDNVLFALLTRNDSEQNKDGIHYRIRTKSMTTASAAANICKQVRLAGHNCLIIIHNQAMWRSSA